MRNRGLLLIAVGLLTLVELTTRNVVLGQTTQSAKADSLQPCDDFATPGRPSLKRRGEPEHPSPTSVEKQTAAVKCSNQKDGQDQDLISIRFLGLVSFPESDVLKLFREERVGLRPDLMPNAETVYKAAAVLKKLLGEKGYLFAVVNVIRDEQFKSITFEVTEGERLLFADVRFEGTKVFSNAELKTVTRECLSRTGDSEVAYDEELLEYCLRNAANFIRSRGHLRAQVGKPRREIIGNRIVVNVPVDEGALHRLGKITIEGADHLSAENIRAMLPLSQGDVVGSDSIGKWLFEDLKKSYGELGYIEYTAEPIPEFRNLSEIEGVVDFKVIIEEGDRFTLRSLEFEGEVLPTAKFINESPLQPGDVYKASAYAAFVKQLHQSGLFEPIDQDRDSDFRLDHEERVVSIRLKLRRRGN